MELISANNEKDLIIQYKEELDANLVKIVKLLQKKEKLQKKYNRKYPSPKKVEDKAAKGLVLTMGISLVLILFSLFNLFNPAIYVDVLLSFAGLSIMFAGTIAIYADRVKNRTIKYGLIAKELSQIEGIKKEITNLEERNKELELKISEELHKRANNDDKEKTNVTTFRLAPKTNNNIKLETKRAR